VKDQISSKIYYYSSKAIAKRSGRIIIKRLLLFNVYQWLFIQSGFKIKWLLMLLILL
jgi:hypothetical protein